MKKDIPGEIFGIYQKLSDKDFKVYFVGGGVRNLLMEKKVKDWDMTTNARPEQILELFPSAFYDNAYGTVGIPLNEQVVEVTTFRSEEGYADRRHPEKVTFGDTIEEDLSRRDFTINAISLKLKDEDFEIIDPFNGQKDIEEKLIRAVGDPSQRFKEDALRLLRAVRLATELSFKIEDGTWSEIKKDASLIKEISWERIRNELFRILASDIPYEGTMLLNEAGLLEHILPELLEGVGVSQVRPGRHHTTDVFTHNVLSLKFAPTDDPIVRFAALLHDVGKPRATGEDKEGLVTFYNHEIIGARIASDISERLRLSKKEKEKVVTLIRWHMFSVDDKITDSAVRRFIRRVGVANVKDIIDLRIGDRLGGGTKAPESWRLKKFKERVEEQLKPKPFGIEDMEVDGNDVMKVLGIPPGKKVGEILIVLFEEVDEDLSKNKKEYLEKRLKEIAK